MRRLPWLGESAQMPKAYTRNDVDKTSLQTQSLIENISSRTIVGKAEAGVDSETAGLCGVSQE